MPVSEHVLHHFKRNNLLQHFDNKRQCEVTNISGNRCINEAKYAISGRGKTGYICGECLGEHVKVNCKYGPVTVEKLGL